MFASFTIAVTLNIISIIAFVFSLIISTVILILLMKSLCHSKDVNLILLTNCYLAMFGFLLISLIMCVDMLKGDYKIFIAQETFSCRIRGYVSYALLATTMNAFSTQVC